MVIRERETDVVYDVDRDRDNGVAAVILGILVVVVLGLLMYFALARTEQNNDMLHQLQQQPLPQVQTIPVPQAIPIPQPQPYAVPVPQPVAQPITIPVPTPMPSQGTITPAPSTRSQDSLESTGTDGDTTAPATP